MKSLKTKLLMVIIPIFILSLGAIAYINHQKAKGFLEANFENEATIKLSLIQSKVDDWTINQKKMIEALVLSDQVASKQPNVQIEYLKSVVKKNSDYEMLFVCNDLTGKQALTSFHSTADISDRDYFKQAIQGKTVVSEPIISKATGKLVVAIATPIYQGPLMIGVFGATLPVEKLMEVVTSEKLGKTGYAYIFNKD